MGLPRAGMAYLYDDLHPKLFILAVLFVLSSLYFLSHDKTYDDNLPTVNRIFAREPHFFSRLRWAVQAKKILDRAYEKV